MVRIILFSLFQCFSFYSFAQTSKYFTNPGENFKYKLVYQLGFINIPAGEFNYSTSKKIIQNHRVYSFDVTGNSLKSYEMIYSMNENIHTYIEPETMNPLWLEIKINQNGHESYQNCSFKSSRKTIYIDYKDYDKPLKHDSCEYTTNTLDFLTAGYTIRSHNFATSKYGEIIPLKVISGTEIHTIYVKYLGREKIILAESQTIECVKLAVSTIPGDIFSKGDEILVWLTSDEKHIPVQFEANVRIGSIKAYILNDLLSYNSEK